MSKVAIVSDSNSGITQEEAKALGVTILPMPFFAGDKTYYEDIDLNQDAEAGCEYFNLDASRGKCD